MNSQIRVVAGRTPARKKPRPPSGSRSSAPAPTPCAAAPGPPSRTRSLPPPPAPDQPQPAAPSGAASPRSSPSAPRSPSSPPTPTDNPPNAPGTAGPTSPWPPRCISSTSCQPSHERRYALKPVRFNARQKPQAPLGYLRQDESNQQPQARRRVSSAGSSSTANGR